MNLSTVILARDEEATIASAIRSVSPICDEVVVCLDPRTNDRTAEVAATAGARVLPLADWRGMEHARNESLRACGGDWILQLDGHEQLGSGGERLLAFLRQADSLNVVSVLLATSEREGGVVAPVPRIVRRGSTALRGEVHPTPPESTRGVLLSGVHLVHDDPRSSSEIYRERQSERFRLLVDEAASETVEPARLSYMIEAAAALDRHWLAVTCGMGWYEGPPGRQAQKERRSFIGRIVSRSLLQQGAYDVGLEFSARVVRDHPSYADAWIALGDALQVLEQPGRASEAYIAALRCPDPRAGWFRRRSNTWLPRVRLAGLSLASGEMVAATRLLHEGARSAGYDPNTTERIAALAHSVSEDAELVRTELASFE